MSNGKPLKDVKVKIGKKEMTLSELAKGGEVLSYDGVQLVYRRPNSNIGVATVFDENKEESRSRTVQADKAETDINLIIDRAIKGNTLMVNQREPRYGDFSSGFDFTENMQRIKAFESEFERLPSQLRARFDNDPAKLIDFASDPANEEEAIKLGILPKKQVVVEPDSPSGDEPDLVPEAPAMSASPVVPAKKLPSRKDKDKD